MIIEQLGNSIQTTEEVKQSSQYQNKYFDNYLQILELQLDFCLKRNRTLTGQFLEFSTIDQFQLIGFKYHSSKADRSYSRERERERRAKHDKTGGMFPMTLLTCLEDGW